MTESGLANHHRHPMLDQFNEDKKSQLCVVT
jgi:hypothetical protein